MNREQIIKAVDDYAERSGLKRSTICQYALQNRHFYNNLKSGKDFRFGTAERLLAWMRDNPPNPKAAE